MTTSTIPTAAGGLTTRPATPERFDDLQTALSGGGDGRSCQCQWFTMSASGWKHSDTAERRDLLRAETAGPCAPGLIGYRGEVPAGWVRVGPRTAQPRLARSRSLRPHATQPWDDPDIWAVTCFVIRREFRGEGLMAELLAAAVEHACHGGARVVEGYPTDTAGLRRSANDLFRGVTQAFLDVGFAEIAHPTPTRAIMARTLSGPDQTRA